MPFVKLVLADLDGTVVAPEANVASPAVLKAIAAAHAKGVKLAAVTGRPFAMAHELLQTMSFNDPCVFEGGAQIIHPVTQQVLWSKELPPETVRTAVEILKKHASIIRYDAEALQPEAIDASTIVKPSLSIWASVPAASAEHVVQTLQTLPSVAVHANAAPGGDQSRCGIQVTHFEADKEHAVRELLKLLNVNKAHTLAIGDGDNDKPLLKHAAVKVAMGNASEGLKQLADYVVESVAEDGFASALRRFVL